jgi:hypothetical protein
MEKKFKASDDAVSSGELVENDITCCEGPSSEPESTASVSTKTTEKHCLSTINRPTNNELDHGFSNFGLLCLTILCSFILSGLLIPFLFLKGVDEIGYAFFILLMGGISSGASLISFFLWSLLTRKGFLGILRFVIALWTPALLSQLLYVIPGCLIRVSHNDHSTSDFVLNVLIYLVLPSLIGSSLALIVLNFRSRLSILRKGKGGKTPLSPEVP